MSNLTDRMIRAAKLDVGLYREVASDRTALKQAMMVVILSSVAGSVGVAKTAIPLYIIISPLLGLAWWYVHAYLIYWVGTKMLPEPDTQSDTATILRATGFSFAPGVIRFLGVIPGVGVVISFVAGIWMLVTLVISIREALNYKSTGRAVGVMLIIIGIFIVFSFLFGLVATGLALSLK